MMASLPSLEVISINDDDDDVVVIEDDSEDLGGDIEILDHVPIFSHVPTPIQSTASPPHPTTSTTMRNASTLDLTRESTSPPRLTFASFNWDSSSSRSSSNGNTRLSSLSTGSRSIARSGCTSTARSRPFSPSSSPMSEPTRVPPEMGSATRPIDLGDNDKFGDYDVDISMFTPTDGYVDDDQGMQEALGANLAEFRSIRDESPLLIRSVEQGRPGGLDNVIFIDDAEDDGDYEIIEEIPRQLANAQAPRKATIYPQRNPPIAAPFVERQKCWFGKHRLIPEKHVEITDGGFLYIKHIIWNSSTDSYILRGHPLQRCSGFNGMLEKKLNELCYFHEVDLDDPRPAEIQSMLEVPLSDVKRIRNVRATNLKFPEDRNLDCEGYGGMQEAAKQGGLTVRWKYTCTYTTAGHRKRNDHSERKLEHIGQEGVKNAKSSDEMRRAKWRGDTLPGGAYIPGQELESDAPTSTIRRGNLIVIGSLSSEPDLHDGSLSRPDVRNSGLPSLDVRKRKRTNENVTAKRLRLDDKRLEATRQGVERLSMEADETVSRRPVIDLDPPVSTRATAIVVEDNERAASIKRTRALSDIHTNQPSRGSKTKACHTLIESFGPGPSRSLAAPLPRQLSDSTTIPLSGEILSRSKSNPIARKRTPGQTLTYGDAFCGCGGTTRGALMAGLRIKWGFDGWDRACAVWQENFPSATLYEMHSADFVQDAKQLAMESPRNAERMKVDILHLSPPCQFFSDAHTVNGKNDELNTASLFAVRHVIEVARPRIVTLEQTFGITRPRFIGYLAALIQMFTSLGFSVRWSIVHLAQWGLPQRRRRLIIIASCPGESLPSFPPPTHAPAGANGLKPFTTVNDTIRRIPRTAPNNNPVSAQFRDAGLRKTPWDGNAILPRAMTTHGGLNYHPSGTRDFTVAEYAAMQGFPPNHVFHGTYIKKMIGNAVPPCAAKVLFEGIKRELDKADGIVEEREVVVVE